MTPIWFINTLVVLGILMVVTIQQKGRWRPMAIELLKLLQQELSTITWALPAIGFIGGWFNGLGVDTQISLFVLWFLVIKIFNCILKSVVSRDGH